MPVRVVVFFINQKFDFNNFNEKLNITDFQYFEWLEKKKFSNYRTTMIRDGGYVQLKKIKNENSFYICMVFRRNGIFRKYVS